MGARKVGFGVIGAGGIARRKTIPAMLRARNLRVVAVMDPVDPAGIARGLGVARHCSREEDLVADPEVEAVYIASPADLHERHVALAASRGKHVLCEKPLGRDPGEVRRAIRACERGAVLLQEGYMMKFHGAHRRIREIIDAGRLGRIVYVRAQLSCWYPPIPGAWRQDPKRGGGGALIDMATHLIDLLEHFVGPVRRAAARTGRLVQAYRSEDASTILLEFASGAQGTIDCFYCIPDEASRTRLEIYGSRGAILTEGTMGQSRGGKVEGIFGLGQGAYDAAQDKDAARRFERIPFPAVDPYRAECEEFAACIIEGRAPELNGPANAIRIAAVTEAAYRSARTGRFVEV